MKTSSIASLLLPAVAAVTASLSAQEKTIQCSALPPAVQQALLAQKDKAPKECTSERDDGQTYYEASFVIDGHSKDLLFDTTGAVVETEEQVDLAALPEGVKDSLVKKASGGKITKVETITKKGTLVAYEAHVSRNGKQSEIQVGPAGATLDHEE